MALPQENNIENEEKNIEVSTGAQKQVDTSELLGLMKKLVDVRADYAIVSAGKAAKDLKQGLDSKVNGLRNWVASEERRYGAKQGEAKLIIEECSHLYDVIYATYNESKKANIARREAYQSEEQYEVLKLANDKNNRITCKENLKTWKTQIDRVENSFEFKQYTKIIELSKSEATAALRSGDYDTVERANDRLKLNEEKRKALYGHYKDAYDADCKKYEDLTKEIKSEKQNIKELRSYIKEQENNIKNESKTALTAIQLATKDKNKELAVLRKENAVSKFFSNIMAKVGGAKKFANNVIEPLKQEVSSLKEDKIPAFKNEIKNKIEEQGIKFQDTMEKAKENAKKVVENSKDVGKIAIATAHLAGVGAKYLGVKIATTLDDISAKDVAGKVTGTVSKGKETVRDIVCAGKEKKNEFLQKVGMSLKEKIEEKIEKISKKKDSLEDLEK